MGNMYTQHGLHGRNLIYGHIYSCCGHDNVAAIWLWGAEGHRWETIADTIDVEYSRESVEGLWMLRLSKSLLYESISPSIT